MSKKIIFGIGTGRCGTHSLHKLMLKQDIMKQNNTFTNKFLYVKHEAENVKSCFTYDGEHVEEKVNSYIEMVNNDKEIEQFYARGQTLAKNNLHIRKNISGKSKCHINISFVLLPFIEKFIEKYDNISIVALKRDKKETIMSIFKRILEGKKKFKIHNEKLKERQLEKQQFEEHRQLEKQKLKEKELEEQKLKEKQLEKQKKREEKKKRKKDKKKKKKDKKDKKDKKNKFVESDMDKLMKQRENELEKFGEEVEAAAKIERKTSEVNYKLSKRLVENKIKFKKMMEDGEIIISSDSEDDEDLSNSNAESDIKKKDDSNREVAKKDDSNREVAKKDELKLGYFYEHFVSKNTNISNIELLKNIKTYYEEYYEKVNYLLSKFPDKIKLYDMKDALNNSSVQKELLMFCGFKYPNIETNIGNSTILRANMV
jgi:hypothetical protein